MWSGTAPSIGGRRGWRNSRIRRSRLSQLTILLMRTRFLTGGLSFLLNKHWFQHSISLFIVLPANAGFSRGWEFPSGS
ncbi:hypothetical protein THIOKS1940011 [Thiocapsa sp. KS1]|nr:hypothetical protein THIOKS1940011 [Thiocapsa sp. KS1]